MITEADTCRLYVLPKLDEAGWNQEPHSFNEQKTFTDGRIVVASNKVNRRPQKRADYLLRYTRDFMIAVVGAKAAYKTPGDGLQQANAIASEAVDGCAASNEFPTFELKQNLVLPRWIHWLTKTRTFWAKCDTLSRGTSGKNRIKPELFLTIEIPLPSLEEQRRIVAYLDNLQAKVDALKKLQAETAAELDALLPSILDKAFKGEL